MKRFHLVIGLLAASAVAPQMTPAANVANFIDFSLRDASNQVLLPGRLYVPPQSLVPSSAPRPLMMYLHGAVANGTDNLAQVAEVKDRMLTEAMQRGAFLYVPQAISTWNTQTITDRVMTMIDRAVHEMNADTHRLYITGYSQGSNGTWTMLSRYEGRFAAAIPISGGNAATDYLGEPISGHADLGDAYPRRRFDLGDGHSEQDQQHSRRCSRAAAELFAWQQLVDLPYFQSKFRDPSPISRIGPSARQYDGPHDI
jgi:poly(3-hydroxybutyrate) depolymerase